MNFENKKLNMSEDDAEKKIKELLAINLSDLLTKYMFLEQQVKKQEKAIDKVLKIIWKNYFVLDKCEIEMLEDTLKEALK